MVGPIFYVYVLFRLNGIPFYVDLGKRGRWLQHEQSAKRNRSHKDRIVLGIQRLGRDVPKVKIAESLTREQAIVIERAFIAAIGRQPNGPLVNLTAGGDGLLDCAESTRAKMSENSRRRLQTPEGRAKRVAAQIRLWQDPEYRARMTAAHSHPRGPHSEEHRRRIGESHKGKVISAETRAKLSAAQLGKPGRQRKREEIARAAETRRRNGIVVKGHPSSPETNAKISAANRGRPSPFRGVKRSQHTKDLLRESKLGERNPSKRPQFRAFMSQLISGRRWITDGCQTTWADKDAPLPEGWRFGRTTKRTKPKEDRERVTPQ